MIAEETHDLEDSKPFSPLQIFLIKVAAVATAVLVVIVFSTKILIGMVEDRLGSVQGGRAFWTTIEEKLYKLADAPDMPIGKRDKIEAALKKVAIKYRPFIDALTRPDAPK